MSDLDVAGHAGCGLLAFRDGAAADDDAVTGSRECACGRRADATVAARNDDFHPAIFQSLLPSRSRFGGCSDREHAIVGDCCTLPTTRQVGGCRGRVQAGEICSVHGGCTRSVATITLRKQLAPSRGFRTKTEPLVTRSLCASKYFAFRMLQDHPGVTLPRFGIVSCK